MGATSESPPEERPERRPTGRRFWRRLRRGFRWLRVSLLLLVLSLLLVVIYLNQVGLPDVLKNRLRSELRTHGLDLQFTRMRLRWLEGIVAENVVFVRPAESASPRLEAQQATLRLDWAALVRRHLQVAALELQRGRFAWPLASTNPPHPVFIVQDVEARVELLPTNTWELTWFRARTCGVKVSLTGALTNAAAIRRWPLPTRRPAARPSDFWRDILALTNQLSLDPNAELTGRLLGDAADLQTCRANLQLNVPRIESPWGRASNLVLSLHIKPERGRHHAIVELTADRSQTRWADAQRVRVHLDADVRTNGLDLASVSVSADAPRTRWGRAQTVSFESQINSASNQFLPNHGSARLTLQQPQTPWGSAAALTCVARSEPVATNLTLAAWSCSAAATGLRTRWGEATTTRLDVDVLRHATNLWPESARARLEAGPLRTPWAQATQLVVTAQTTVPASDVFEMANTNLSWWGRAQRLPVQVQAEVAQVQTTNLLVPRLTLITRWRAPEWTIDQLSGSFGRGSFAAGGTVQAHTRRVGLRFDSQIEPGVVASLLGPRAQGWVTNLHFIEAPKLAGAIEFTLPGGRNGGSNWLADVLPTAIGHADLLSGPGSFRDVTVAAVRSTVTLSSAVVSLPELAIHRSEGGLHCSGSSDLGAQTFHFRIHSSLDPQVIPRVMDQESARQALGLFEFRQPPQIEAEVLGSWRDIEAIGVRGRFQANNFSFRGQAMAECTTAVSYTNRLLMFTNAHIVREEGEANGGEIRVDFNRRLIALTNVAGTIDKDAVTRAIGPHVERAMAPYRFGRAPRTRVEGTVGLRAIDALEDLQFDALVPEFHWKDFHFGPTSAGVHWRGDTLVITNFNGAFHDGSVRGAAYFNFAPDPGTDFSLQLTASNVNLATFARDLSTHTNRLEGTLSGYLIVTQANTADLDSWNGYGVARLHDGLLWEFPLFSVFSPILNRILPGLGNSRAREATANFTITNSVIHSGDLEVRATAMRMQMEGTVDFDQRVRARATAELFRNTPGIGWLLSTVLWPVTKVFEYKVTGTLHHPNAEPLYIPKFLLAPLHPVRTIKELLSEEKKPQPEQKQQGVSGP